MSHDLTTEQIENFLRAFAARVIEDQRALSDLDAAAGDADHGANLSRGMRAITAMLDAETHGTPGSLLKTVGMKIVDTVGGSSGALYGTIFLRLAAAAGEDAGALDSRRLSRGFHSAAQGVVDRGGARLGDKTMYDALKPAADTLAEQIDAGLPLGEALGFAADAAGAGARATESMRARRGKSSYVGQSSVGNIDPGAVSVAWMIECLAASANTDQSS